LVSTALLISIAAFIGWSYYQKGEQIRRLLTQAEAARIEDRLLTPTGNSALDYYQQVLEIDRQNTDAKNGIQALAGHYLALAREAQLQKRYQDALLYITRGLSVSPYDIVLIDLKAQVEQEHLTQQQKEQLAREKKLAPQTKTPAPSEKTGNFFQRLFD